MPRKPGRDAGRGLVEEPAEEPVQVSAADEAYERIESIKERFGDDATGRAQIQRRLKDGRLIGLPSIPALTFDTDLVAKRYGGGRYYVRFYRGREYQGDIEFELDESLKPEPPETPKPLASNGDTPTWLAATLDKIGDAIRVMAENQNRPAPAPPAAPDPLAMIKAVGEAARSMMPATPATEKPLGLREQIGLVKDIVEMGADVVEARGGGGGGSEDTGDVYMRGVMKLGEPIIEAVADHIKEQRRAARPAGPIPIRPGLPAGATTDAAGRPNPAPRTAAAPAQGADTVMPPWLVELRRLMPVIISRFNRGVSAENTAYFVLDDLSDVTKARIAEFAARDDFAQQIGRFLPPEFASKPEWVEEFLVAVQDYLLGGPEDEELEDEPEGGDEGAGGGDEQTDDGASVGRPADRPSRKTASRSRLDARAQAALDAAPEAAHDKDKAPAAAPAKQADTETGEGPKAS